LSNCTLLSMLISPIHLTLPDFSAHNICFPYILLANGTKNQKIKKNKILYGNVIQ
jgi:hypothetical protein